MILGASYGSLLGTKLQFGGHKIKLICRPSTVAAINKHGARVRLPIKGRDEVIELDSRMLPGELSAAGPAEVDPSDYDLVALAMQEAHYSAPEVRKLLSVVAKAKVPCMSIMNMPPLPYLKRIPGLDSDALRTCYADASVWDDFDPSLMTLCSPDPQAIRLPDNDKNVLQVTLPTNFKVSRFDSEPHTSMLRQLQADIEAVRFDPGDGAIELPIKCPSPNGRCCSPAITVACRKKRRFQLRTPCTAILQRRGRSMTGSAACVRGWVQVRKIWFPSSLTPTLRET